MKRRMTRTEARAFVRRWQVANRAEVNELRQTSYITKLRQLESLMRSADALGRSESSETEDREVLARWTKLRKAYGV